ncbi:MAG: Wzz/FepE/Etk N-terminal domain-containing protein [Flavobacteriales bacterium]|jgi:uncharacterized protein involved in exopolysaccharide biosynthesis|nr:Wzz/FepE/Etk N-terminal domain-containing protein [Flavobacteriales bacterium]
MNDNSVGLIFLFNNRKLLVLAALLGGILGIGITFLIPKKYLSTAIIYPYNSHKVNEIIANPQFGYEVESEQLMQLLESKSMRDKTVERFKLYDYYEKDTTDLKWKAELTLKYIKDITFFRSKYLSIVINVKTKDPKLSADIANFQVKEVNRYREQVFQENREKSFKSIENKYKLSKKRLEALKDSIYSIKGGTSDLLYNFVENLNNENYDTHAFIDDARLEPVIEQYLYERGRYLALRVKYDQMKELIAEPLPSVYSIDIAEPSYKKVSPSFLINALVGALIFFILVLTIRMVGGQWSSLKERARK